MRASKRPSPIWCAPSPDMLEPGEARGARPLEAFGLRAACGFEGGKRLGRTGPGAQLSGERLGVLEARPQIETDGKVRGVDRVAEERGVVGMPRPVAYSRKRAPHRTVARPNDVIERHREEFPAVRDDALGRRPVESAAA